MAISFSVSFIFKSEVRSKKIIQQYVHLIKTILGFTKYSLVKDKSKGPSCIVAVLGEIVGFVQIEWWGWITKMTFFFFVEIPITLWNTIIIGHPKFRSSVLCISDHSTWKKAEKVRSF